MKLVHVPSMRAKNIHGISKTKLDSGEWTTSIIFTNLDEDEDQDIFVRLQTQLSQFVFADLFRVRPHELTSSDTILAFENEDGRTIKVDTVTGFSKDDLDKIDFTPPYVYIANGPFMMNLNSPNFIETLKEMGVPTNANRWTAY